MRLIGPSPASVSIGDPARTSAFTLSGKRAATIAEDQPPLYLLAGESDDITTSEQVFAAENLVGTPKGRIEKKLDPGGHIGLFMGSRTLTETWPTIARWLPHSGSA